MRRLITEFIGTFFLVFIIGMVAAGDRISVLAIGFGLMVLVYMGGPISGAHYNPAVTFALLLGKRIKGGEAVGYWLSQIVGGAAGALAAHYLTGVTFAPMPGVGVDVAKALVNEVLFTFLLVMVIHMVAVHPKAVGTHFYGFAIGATIVAAAYAGGGISGGAYNPAVSIGPSLVNAAISNGSIEYMWITVVGPLLGATLAYFVYEFIAKEDLPST